MLVFSVPVTLILVHLGAKSVLALPILPDELDARGDHQLGAMYPPLHALHQTALEELLGAHTRPNHALPRLQEQRPRPPRPHTPEDIERGERKKEEVGGVSVSRQRRLQKRTEGAKIPTVGLGKGAPFFSYVGLGVLSDLRNFFTELRTNLDSVEALAQEQGANALHPEDLLALLAKEEARSQALTDLSNDTLPQGFPIRSLIFGTAPKDQRYANSGLGK
ncbi:uncharacterized protein LOC123502666 isoform X1 [Portunus trituberculatus]|uniref:uncharacterized protein LOC123502666 isoform X1 n=1 Tax=Portunus trituberculatus TaxID=210409 RepID=UPI001E1CD60F|nr:uncharacterized protein LOC123502666 isoform X1 [Portunus trituberculatus]